jgi:hypothetical protein
MSDHGMAEFASSWAAFSPRASLFRTAAAGENWIKAAHELQCVSDALVAALKRLRSGHVKMASLYVVNQARAQNAAAAILVPVQSVENEGGELTTDRIKGACGTILVPFLKKCSDNTTRAMVHPPSPKPP